MQQKYHQIEVLDTGARFLCGEHECILEAMKRAHCGPIRHGCFGGGCGVCKMRIVSGSYAIVKKMSRAHVTEQERQAGTVLICCVRPLGKIIIAQV